MTSKITKYNLIWVLSIAPILGLLLQALVSNLMAFDFHISFFIVLILNWGLAFQDMFRLRENGTNVSKLGSPIIIPIYLFKRAKLMKRFPIYSIIWSMSFIVMLSIPPDMIKEFAWSLTNWFMF